MLVHYADYLKNITDDLMRPAWIQVGKFASRLLRLGFAPDGAAEFPGGKLRDQKMRHFLARWIAAGLCEIECGPILSSSLTDRMFRSGEKERGIAGLAWNRRSSELKVHTPISALLWIGFFSIQLQCSPFDFKRRLSRGHPRG